MNPPKVVVFKKPKSIIAKQTKTIDDLWPSIITYVMDNPHESNTSVYHKFGQTLNLAFTTFCRYINERDIEAIRKAAGRKVKKPSKDKSIQLTENIAKSFAERRRQQGIIHLDKMDHILQRATKVMTNESKSIAAMDPKLASIHIESHLDKSAKLHKLAKDVYAIDAESSEDKAKANMAILISYVPKPTTEDVIDI